MIQRMDIPHAVRTLSGLRTAVAARFDLRFVARPGKWGKRAILGGYGRRGAVRGGITGTGGKPSKAGIEPASSRKRAERSTNELLRGTRSAGWDRTSVLPVKSRALYQRASADVLVAGIIRLLLHVL